MDTTVLAHGGAAGGVAEMAIVLVPLAVIGVMSLVRKRKAKVQPVKTKPGKPGAI